MRFKLQSTTRTMNQNKPSPRIQSIAQRLVSLEATAQVPEGHHPTPAVFQVCEKLRRPLGSLAGTTGFRSLLSRALTLAQREQEALRKVQVSPDGSLVGLNGESTETGAVLIAHLIELLETFIGETLTLRLLHEVWPVPPELLKDFGERNEDERTQERFD
jgi:hypothetical protein